MLYKPVCGTDEIWKQPDSTAHASKYYTVLSFESLNDNEMHPGNRVKLLFPDNCVL